MKSLKNRELSWLSFNYRVLQEAKDPINPLYEQIKFLAIWSSNLDEFFRVRVASLRSLLSLKKKSQKTLKFDPAELLKKIHQEVQKQQEEFGNIFTKQIKPELIKNNIFLLKETELNDYQLEYIKEYYEEYIKKYIQPFLLVNKKIIPFLQNNRLYFAIKLAPKKTNSNKRIKHTYAMIEIPDNRISRFVKLPSEGDKHCVIFIDDILRYNIPKIFKEFKVVEIISIKLTRDAELYIDDEFEGNLLEKIRKGLHKRDTGIPSRFLFDQSISKEFKQYLKGALNLSNEDLVSGGRYHNYNDFFHFPLPAKNEHLSFVSMPPLRSQTFDAFDDKFELIKEKDRELFFPYQTYDHVIEFLEQAASDKNVTSIKITQYRVAKESAVLKSLIKAKKQGKDVMIFVELKARFDEERNIIWAREMESAGIKVIYSFPGLKVHAKLALITRKESGKEKLYSYLSTGNFNENTAKVYGDFGLFTADDRMTFEIQKVFEFLSGQKVKYEFKHLLVAQFNIREKFTDLINNEITNASQGKEAAITVKLNSIEDPKIIKHLYKASQAGVKISLITRGICCLIPGKKRKSENVHCISILDRFLEHARFFIFHNDGNEKIYAGSADWMRRNLNRRVEVIFPIYDEDIKRKINDIISLQLNDNVKARIIDEKDHNKYKLTKDDKKIRSQYAAYEYIKNDFTL